MVGHATSCRSLFLTKCVGGSYRRWRAYKRLGANLDVLLIHLQPNLTSPSMSSFCSNIIRTPQHFNSSSLLSHPSLSPILCIWIGILHSPKSISSHSPALTQTILIPSHRLHWPWCIQTRPWFILSSATRPQSLVISRSPYSTVRSRQQTSPSHC